ncbi:hypothetical protein [Vagococcus hydrophili]|uniref:Uncharacterized protein n=1 Tax=Vagococcus hydrophili TaxID=2714947 RepID=A0A6G8ATJ1_9ENTE|nr:hypothetical protein [Vagococcus hydrophili]QIL48262.1 hypothetical protein G7082_07035 [Vagococcus hydrophili]
MQKILLGFAALDYLVVLGWAGMALKNKTCTTPDKAVRSFLFNKGFYLKNLTCNVEETDYFFTKDNELELDDNQNIYKITPALYEKKTDTYLEYFSLKKEEKKYVVEVFEGM